ncbi:MAG: histidine kinase, partial [Bacteroidota bacterium]
MSLAQQTGIAKNILLRIGSYFLIGTLVPLVLCGSNCFDTWEDIGQTILFGTVACVVLWEGNGRATVLLDKYVDWLKTPMLRFILGTVVMVVYTMLSVLLMSQVFVYFLSGEWPSEVNWMSGTIIYSGIATTIISLFLHSRKFLLNWQQEAVRAEKLKNEQLNSQYQTLKNQLQPHFLFNSLSALTTLVHSNPDQATIFIQRLSEMYRYILEYAQEQVVPLEKELDFLRSYLFLMKIRFGENLQVEIESPESTDWLVAPLTLQLLAENAIKHNEVSSAHPLTIKVIVSETSSTLSMTNPLQLREIPRESTGVGLTNIRNRYDLITDYKVVISQTSDTFTV